jgi:hypothetical protein
MLQLRSILERESLLFVVGHALQGSQIVVRSHSVLNPNLFRLFSDLYITLDNYFQCR